MYQGHHITKLLADQRAAELQRETAPRGFSHSKPGLTLRPARGLRRLQRIAAAKAGDR
jgi:hypothetical protein